MIGLLFLVVVYRYYAKLAKNYGKRRWEYGLLGCGLFMLLQICFGVIGGILSATVFPSEVEEEPSFTGFTLFNVVGWFVSLAGVWFVHQQLEKKFSKQKSGEPSIDIELIGNEKFDK